MGVHSFSGQAISYVSVPIRTIILTPDGNSSQLYAAYSPPFDGGSIYGVNNSLTPSPLIGIDSVFQYYFNYYWYRYRPYLTFAIPSGITIIKAVLTGQLQGPRTIIDSTVNIYLQPTASYPATTVTAWNNANSGSYIGSWAPTETGTVKNFTLSPTQVASLITGAENSISLCTDIDIANNFPYNGQIMYYPAGYNSSDPSTYGITYYASDGPGQTIAPLGTTPPFYWNPQPPPAFSSGFIPGLFSTAPYWQYQTWDVEFNPPWSEDFAPECFAPLWSTTANSVTLGAWSGPPPAEPPSFASQSFFANDLGSGTVQQAPCSLWNTPTGGTTWSLKLEYIS